MSDTLIRVDGVSKKFCRRLRTSLWYGLQDVGAELLGRPHRSEGALREDEFWAVQDVSFSLRRGECVGLIGHNGAGKTTLLRMLNGLIRPDRGRIEIRGRVGALIALGAGFHPSLTGRENVFVNAAILGLSREEAGRRFDEIVEFSGLAQHIDSPVQNYSSGMFVRLGFAVAAHVEPDVLLVDEALAVGDVAFAFRCLNRIAALRKNGTGVVFVSHNELQVREAAQRCLVLAGGKLCFDGALDPAFASYELHRAAAGTTADAGFVLDGPIRLESCTFWGGHGTAMVTGQEARIDITCRSEEAIPGADFWLRIWNSAGQLISTVMASSAGTHIRIPSGAFVVSVRFAELTLLPGRYRLAGGFVKNGEFLGWARDLAHLTVSVPHGAVFGAGSFFAPSTVTVAPLYQPE